MRKILNNAKGKRNKGEKGGKEESKENRTNKIVTRSQSKSINSQNFHEDNWAKNENKRISKEGKYSESLNLQKPSKSQSNSSLAGKASKSSLWNIAQNDSKILESFKRFAKNEKLPNFQSFSIYLRNCFSHQNSEASEIISAEKHFPLWRFEEPIEAKPLLEEIVKIKRENLNFTELSIDSFLKTRNCSILKAFAFFLIEAEKYVAKRIMFDRICVLIIAFIRFLDKQGFTIISENIKDFKLNPDIISPEHFCRNNTMAFAFEASNSFFNSQLKNIQSLLKFDDYGLEIGNSSFPYNKIKSFFSEMAKWFRENDFSLTILKIRI